MSEGGPVFLKRAKNKGSARKAREAEPEAAVDEESSTVVLSSVKKRDKTKAKPVARVSFQNDDEDSGEVFQVKKSKLSSKIKLGGSQGSPIPALTNSFNETTISPASDGPRYDSAYLAELRANTMSAPVPQNKPAAGVQDEEMTFDASEMDGAVIENLSDFNAVSTLSNAADETMIPSESSIKAAKEKRERIRKVGNTEEDFISLTVSKRDDFAKGPHPNSRLVREEDEMGEGDDDMAEYTGAQERIALSKKGRKEEVKKLKVGISEMIEEAQEDDEESMEWELAQTRRGDAHQPVSLPKDKPTYRPTPIPTVIPLTTLDASVNRLTASLTALTTSHASSTKEMISIGEERTKLDAQEQEMRQQVEKAEEKRAWFASFKEKVESVADFLDEKYSGLEKLEAEQASLISERAEMVRKRREDDDEDDLVLVYGLPRDMEVSDQVDDLGRTIPSSSGINSSLRRERRAERTKRCLNRPKNEDEGSLTDSTLSPSDTHDFEQAIQKLQNKVRGLFDDVKVKEFQNPKYGLLVWFGEWRDKWPESYNRAWGGMGMVQAWEFWVRVELVGWLPLDVSPRLEDFTWYQTLYSYSHTDEEEEIKPEDDLAIQMCSTALIPRLNALIVANAFDPYSKQHVVRAIDLAEQLEAYLGPDDVKYQSVLQAIAHSFRLSFTSIQQRLARFNSLGTAPPFQPESVPARHRLMSRVGKLLTNVLRWRKYTKERHGLGLLCGEILADLLLPLARGGWETGGKQRLQQAVKSVPQDLVPPLVRFALVD